MAFHANIQALIEDGFRADGVILPHSDGSMRVMQGPAGQVSRVAPWPAFDGARYVSGSFYLDHIENDVFIAMGFGSDGVDPWSIASGSSLAMMVTKADQHLYGLTMRPGAMAADSIDLGAVNDHTTYTLAVRCETDKTQYWINGNLAGESAETVDDLDHHATFAVNSRTGAAFGHLRVGTDVQVGPI